VSMRMQPCCILIDTSTSPLRPKSITSASRSLCCFCNLLRTYYGETDVMDFSLNRTLTRESVNEACHCVRCFCRFYIRMPVVRRRLSRRYVLSSRTVKLIESVVDRICDVQVTSSQSQSDLSADVARSG